MSSQDTKYCQSVVTCRNLLCMMKTAEGIEREENRLQFDAEVGERITTLRKRAGLSQKALAAAINVTESTMSGKITAGPWYAHELGVIAKLVGSTLDVLYGIDDIPPAPVASLVGRRRNRPVGLDGLEPPTISVKSRQLADVIPFPARTA